MKSVGSRLAFYLALRQGAENVLVNTIRPQIFLIFKRRFIYLRQASESRKILLLLKTVYV